MLATMGAEAFAERAGRDLLATGETVRKRTVEWHLREVALTQLGPGRPPGLTARDLAAVDVQDLAGDVGR
jgi:hypothetical protein